jgi:hypothetical protein
MLKPQVLRLEEVFKTNGLPTITFVQPSRYTDWIVVDLCKANRTDRFPNRTQRKRTSQRPIGKMETLFRRHLN